MSVVVLRTPQVGVGMLVVDEEHGEVRLARALASGPMS